VERGEQAGAAEKLSLRMERGSSLMNREETKRRSSDG